MMKDRSNVEADRYLRIADWARARYRQPDGSWIRVVGNGIAGRERLDGRAFMVPSRYSLIEDMAAARYLGTSRFWPAETLATAYRDPEGREARGALRVEVAA